jgi:sulfofructose kinase
MTNSSQVDVVGVGLNATDTLISVTPYPARGSKVEFRSATVLPGRSEEHTSELQSP